MNIFLCWLINKGQQKLRIIQKKYHCRHPISQRWSLLNQRSSEYHLVRRTKIRRARWSWPSSSPMLRILTV